MGGGELKTTYVFETECLDVESFSFVTFSMAPGDGDLPCPEPLSERRV